MNNTKSSTCKKVFVVIPAYNEAPSIGAIVKSALSLRRIDTCVVVDDGSQDDTAVLARRSGAVIIQSSHNEGTGSAVKKGLQYSLQKHADAVVIMDADGQHDPVYIPKLLSRLHDNVDYVIASRYYLDTPQSTQKIRAFATQIISMIFRKFLGIKIFDSTSGFRAINRVGLEYLCMNYPKIFPEPEIILNLQKKKFSIAEISIPMGIRKYGHSSISLCKGLYLIGYIFIKIVSYRLTMHSLQ